MRLAKALRLESTPRLALVGAGGKTTALFQLARQILARANPPPCVLLTTSTHLGVNQISLADHHFIIHSPDKIQQLEHAIPPGVVLFTGLPNQSYRVMGLGDENLAELLALANRFDLPLLMEADGARLRPLKAPAKHEPAIPNWIETVVVVAGMSGIGQPLEARWVHRPERFAELTGLLMGSPISVDALARLLANPEGGLKSIPSSARRVALLNQADTPDLQASGFDLADKLLDVYQAVSVATLAHPGKQPPDDETVVAAFEPVAGIILAAGTASRLGQPKQVLPWRGQPLVRHVAQAALFAGLSPVIAITGAYPSLVQQALSGLPVQIIDNPSWQAGMSASVITAVHQLPQRVGSAIFLLADQPQVHPTLLRSLVETHARSLSLIVAPLVNGQRANPVLFDRQVFPELLKISGDVGGRMLLSRHAITYLPWHDSSLLLDVDHPEDYQQLLEME